MRMLWISTLVATSWALQVSWYDIHRRSVRCPLSLQCDVDDEVTLLRAKLDLLQAVVKELHHKNLKVENDTTLLLEASEIKRQESSAIASAAVEAAETRSSRVESELRALQRRHKKAQVYCNLQRLVIKGLLDKI